MTVKELIEKLKTYDQEDNVKVLYKIWDDEVEFCNLHRLDIVENKDEKSVYLGI